MRVAVCWCIVTYTSVHVDTLTAFFQRLDSWITTYNTIFSEKYWPGPEEASSPRCPLQPLMD